MPQITALKIQKNKKIVNLFLDNKFSFGISLEEIVQRGLFVGQELSVQEIKELFFSSQLDKLYNKTLNFLSYRPRSEKEIKRYLFKNSPPLLRKKVQAEILIRLKKQKLIDDFQFSSWWIEQRMTFNPRGRNLLRSELVQKGIAKDIINKALLLIDKQQLIISAKKIIEKKKRFYQKIPRQKLRNRLFSCLIRRGFNFSLVKTLIDESINK